MKAAMVNNCQRRVVLVSLCRCGSWPHRVLLESSNYILNLGDAATADLPTEAKAEDNPAAAAAARAAAAATVVVAMAGAVSAAVAVAVAVAAGQN